MKNQFIFNSPYSSRSKRFTVPSSNISRTTSDLFKRFSGWEGNVPFKTCDSYVLIGRDLVEHTSLFRHNVQYLMQKMCASAIKKMPSPEQQICVKFCYKLGEVTTKLANVKSGIRWWSIKPVNKCEWYDRKGLRFVGKDLRSGRQPMSLITEVDAFKSLSSSNRRSTVREMTEDVATNATSRVRIWAENPGMQHVTKKNTFHAFERTTKRVQTEHWLKYFAASFGTR